MKSASNLFSSLSKNDTTRSIHIAYGYFMNLSYKGSISLSSLSLPDTYLIPKLNFNLNSVGQLSDHAYELAFSFSGCHV